MIKICLDAGHYGKYNQSPTVKGYYESNMTWKLHLKLKAELEKYEGVSVVTTRSNQSSDLSLYKRGIASKGCDLFLSLHSNAVGSHADESVDYPLIIVQLDGKGDTLGQKLVNCVDSVMGTKQQGYTTKRRSTKDSGEYYTVLRGAADVGTMGMIIEHSFHTNTKMAEWLLNDANLAKLAKEEATVIANYYGLKPKQATPTIPTVTVTLSQLSKGSKGEQVKTLQRLLIAMKYDLGYYGADGDFGGKTDEAVRKFQKDNKLAIDGIVGKDTWNALLK